MANETTKPFGTTAEKSIADRTKKSAATRAITAAKTATLMPELRYALSQCQAARKAIATVEDHILNGGKISGDVLQSLSLVVGNVGLCLFS